MQAFIYIWELVRATNEAFHPKVVKRSCTAFLLVGRRGGDCSVGRAAVRGEDGLTLSQVVVVSGTSYCFRQICLRTLYPSAVSHTAL